MTTNIPITPDFIRTVTGGPAFPNNHPTQQGVPGMTLRDWFAAASLERLVPSYHPEGAAIAAYQYADAMLAQREKQP